MFRVGDRIRLKQEIVNQYKQHGSRPHYFNDGGYMDYMFDDRVMTITRIDSDFKVYVDREEWHPYPENHQTWMLVHFDVELAEIDNRLLA